MELLDQLNYKPTAMSEAFQEAMRTKAKGGNAPVDMIITKLPVGTEIKKEKK